MQYLSHPVEEQGRHHHSDDHMLHITYVHRLQPSLVRIDAAKLKSRNNLLSKLALSVPTTVSGFERCTGRQWSIFSRVSLYIGTVWPTAIKFDGNPCGGTSCSFGVSHAPVSIKQARPKRFQFSEISCTYATPFDLELTINFDRYGNIYGKGRVLGVSHATAYCIDRSRRCQRQLSCFLRNTARSLKVYKHNSQNSGKLTCTGYDSYKSKGNWASTFKTSIKMLRKNSADNRSLRIDAVRL